MTRQARLLATFIAAILGLLALVGVLVEFARKGAANG